MNATNCIFSVPKNFAFKRQKKQHPKLSVEGDIIIEKKILCPRSQDESHISVSKAEHKNFFPLKSEKIQNICISVLEASREFLNADYAYSVLICKILRSIALESQIFIFHEFSKRERSVLVTTISTQESLSFKNKPFAQKESILSKDVFHGGFHRFLGLNCNC